MSAKQHYFLLSGSIVFSIGDLETSENTQPTNVLVNAIVRHSDVNFPARKLAKAQQNLHKSFIMKLPDPHLINIHDIVILSISYLGEMTEEEFQATPEEPKLPNETPIAPNSALEA